MKLKISMLLPIFCLLYLWGANGVWPSKGEVRKECNIETYESYIYKNATQSSMCDLSGAQLPFQYLAGANLPYANLFGANLQHVILDLAILDGADMRHVDLFMAHLIGAKLTGVDLSTSYMRNATLHNADLKNADLSYADLCGADFTNADLRGAKLWGAKLAPWLLGYTIFRGAIVDPEQAKYLSAKGFAGFIVEDKL